MWEAQACSCRICVAREEQAEVERLRRSELWEQQLEEDRAFATEAAVLDEAAASITPEQIAANPPTKKELERAERAGHLTKPKPRFKSCWAL